MNDKERAELENSTTEKNGEKKESFFTNLNKFAIQSGILMAGITGLTANIQEQVIKTKNEAQKKIVVNALLFIGAIFALYGAVQVVVGHFDLTLYTNLILGLLLLVCAFIFRVLKK